jgi:hypothetical protein
MGVASSQEAGPSRGFQKCRPHGAQPLRQNRHSWDAWQIFEYMKGQDDDAARRHKRTRKKISFLNSENAKNQGKPCTNLF